MGPSLIWRTSSNASKAAGSQTRRSKQELPRLVQAISAISPIIVAARLYGRQSLRSKIVGNVFEIRPLQYKSSPGVCHHNQTPGLLIILANETTSSYFAVRKTFGSDFTLLIGGACGLFWSAKTEVCVWIAHGRG